MRILCMTCVLLAPVVAGANFAHSEDLKLRAFINVHLPKHAGSIPDPDLVFRFDINESQDACGNGNISVNGQKLSDEGYGPLNMGSDREVDAHWNLTCVTWKDKPQEQLLSLNVDHVNGQAVEDVGFTLRFQQVSPVWISDVEGSVSVTRVYSTRHSQAQPDNDDRRIDLDAELAELDHLHWQMAELAYLLHVKEHRLAEAFGCEERPPHWPAPTIHECDSLKCFIKAVAHIVKGAASSFNGGERREHHHRGTHHDIGQSAQGNHTDNGTHPYSPPHGTKPHFPYRPPFCKSAPQPIPPHGDMPLSPPGPGFDHHPFHHRRPGLWGSLFGYGPPPPMPWQRPDWEHRVPDEHHGHGHGHKEGPPRISHDDHPGHADEDRKKEHPKQPEGLGHDGHKPSDEDHHERPEYSRPSPPEEHHPEEHHTDKPWETELRRGRDSRFPPHDGPHDREESHGRHAPPPGPPPPPHGLVFIHIASGIASLVLIIVFSSVLYQRYVRKSIRSPRRRHNSPWYKRLCFGPNYSELSEDEEKEAMLRNCGDSDSDSEDDSNVFTGDISQFRTAADVVDEMVTVEEARMMSHAHQLFSSPPPAPVSVPVQLQQEHVQPQPEHMRSYISTHSMQTNGIPMPMIMPTGQLGPGPITMATMATMFPDLAADYDMNIVDHARHGVGAVVSGGEELPAYREADRQSDSDESEFASSIVTDGYRPGCPGSSYMPSEFGSQGASDILGDTKH